MTKLTKSLLACAIAAFVSGFLFMEWQDYSVNSYKPWGDILRMWLHPSWGSIGVLTLIAFLLMTCLGLPLQHLWLKPPRNGLLWHIGLTLIITTAVLAVLLLPASGFFGIWALLDVYVAAILAIVLFWLIRRPDRDVMVCPLPGAAT